MKKLTGMKLVKEIIKQMNAGRTVILWADKSKSKKEMKANGLVYAGFETNKKTGKVEHGYYLKNQMEEKNRWEA